MKYMDTPFGIIPNDWSLAPISDVTDLVTDYVANGSFASLAENVTYKDTEDVAVLIRLVDYKNDFKGNFVFIDDHAYEFLGKSKLYGGEIIISNVGANVGTVFRCPKLQYKMSLAPNAIMVKFKENDDFYFFWLRSHAGQHMLHSIVSGSAQPKFNKTNFRDMLVPVPPRDQQDKIVSILQPLENKIEQNNQINDNLQQQAFALFDKLMFDVDNDACTVSDYAYLNPRRVLSKSQIARSIDMSQLSTSGAFPLGWDMKPYNGGMRFTNGDTLLARITPCLENGKTAFVDFLDKDEVAFGSTEYIVLAPRNGVPPEMLYCLARYPAFVDYAVKNMNGSSGRQRVSAETIGQFQLPKLDEQSLSIFRESITPMFLKMRYNSLENTRLAELRDTLLPKLMSGEISVSSIQL